MNKMVKIEFPDDFEGVVIERDLSQSWEFRAVAYTRLITDAQILTQTLLGINAGEFMAFSRVEVEKLNGRSESWQS